DADTLNLAQTPLHVVQLIPVTQLDFPRQRVGAGETRGVLRYDDHGAHAFGEHLSGDIGDRECAFDRLAAGHRDGIVAKNLESDVDASGARGPNREGARMRVRPVPEVLEHVPGMGEAGQADPVRTFATHLAHRQRATLRVEQCHAVTPDTRECERPLWNMGGGVVRAAGTEGRSANRKDRVVRPGWSQRLHGTRKMRRYRCDLVDRSFDPMRERTRYGCDIQRR